jgi:hypothetical protein
MSVTQYITAQTTQAQSAVNIQNLQDTRRINAQNMEAALGRMVQSGAMNMGAGMNPAPPLCLLSSTMWR